MIENYNDGNSLLQLAQSTIRLEWLTLKALEEGLNQNFVKGVASLHQSTGRIIVTGMGKSALIGKKIVATFNSTGSPSIFMHAADAIHGDLGILQQGDVLICLSKSGETAEIKNLVPLVKQMGHPILAIVANKDSYLAKQADTFIYTPVEREADPNNLAPTASAMAQMAVGDALATCLMALRGFKERDFAILHPGGALGKKLHLKVADLAGLHERPIVHEKASIKKVILEISSKRLGATAVVDKTGKYIGIITDGDLRRMLEEAGNFKKLCAEDIMTRTPKTISCSALASSALSLMQRNNITQLLVTDKNDDYLGVIHIHDLLREGIG